MSYLMPFTQRDLPAEDRALPLHTSASIGPDNDVSIFLRPQRHGQIYVQRCPKRKLIRDGDHVWHSKGVFSIEGGWYAKCIGLAREK